LSPFAGLLPPFLLFVDFGGVCDPDSKFLEKNFEINSYYKYQEKSFLLSKASCAAFSASNF
jgi:hypothetical protein